MNHGESHYPQIQKTWNSRDPCQKWLVYQNYSMSATTHLKKVVYAGKHSNVAEFKQFCKEGWAKVPPQ